MWCLPVLVHNFCRVLCLSIVYTALLYIFFQENCIMGLLCCHYCSCCILCCCIYYNFVYSSISSMYIYFKVFILYHSVSPTVHTCISNCCCSFVLMLYILRFPCLLLCIYCSHCSVVSTYFYCIYS